MTTEDKNWLYIGAGLIATGGLIYWYKNKNTGETVSTDQPKYVEDKPTATPELATPKYSNSGTSKTVKPTKTSTAVPKYKVPINIPETKFMYAKGQKLMCNDRNGLIAYDVQKKADNTFFTNTKKVKTFNYGEEIGTIVGQLRSKGFVYYVVTGIYEFGSESFDSRYFWINHHETKALAPLLKTINLINVPTLDVNKILSKGSKGLEVFELQKRLKIKVDGDFGNDTESALFRIKKVKSISINQF